jgi:hypothetical protein
MAKNTLVAANIGEDKRKGGMQLLSESRPADSFRQAKLQN